MSSTLEDFWASFDRAWDSHSASAVLAHFDDGCVLSFIDGRVFLGKVEIERFYREAFAQMKGGLVHRASIQVESGLDSRGLFQITNADGRSELVAGSYELELSSRRLILRLSLKKNASSLSVQTAPTRSDGLP